MKKLRCCCKIPLAEFLAVVLGIEGGADVGGLLLLGVPCDVFTLRCGGF